MLHCDLIGRFQILKRAQKDLDLCNQTLLHARVYMVRARDYSEQLLRRLWLTWWKTKLHVIVSNFFPGFIGNSSMSFQCTLVFGDTHIVEHKFIS